MAHARAPRAERRRQAKLRPYLEGAIPEQAPAARSLVQSNVIPFPAEKQHNRRQNQLPFLSQEELHTISTIIDRRYEAAEPVTNQMAAKMDRLESMYRGEWLDEKHKVKEHIYLAKAREALQVVSAFLYGMVLQVPTLVQFRPAPTSLTRENVRPLWRRAKLSEALTNYYLEDIWDVRHTIIRDFIKTFLKFPVAIMRIDYLHSSAGPDLRFEVVDRALQYIDPYAHRIKDAGWWIEKTFLSRAECEERFEQGHWERPPDLPDALPTLASTGTDDAILQRFFGRQYNENIPIESDDLVEVWEYRQARARGIDDVYAVKLGGIGGWLVRYGPNPYPGPDIPYCGDSFDRHEWQIDGHGLLEMHEALQEIINTVLNLRLDDLRESLWNPTIVPDQLVDDQTLDDIEDRSKLVRGSQAFMDLLLEKGVKLSDLQMQLPMNDNASKDLYQDLAFLLGQNHEVGHSGDVFRGQTPSKVTTAQEIQEALTNNQGVFRPAFMSIMQTIEDAARVANSYFRDQDFFGAERIILATGGRYQDVIREWDIDDGDLRAAAVSFDDMQVDVSISAINGAEAMLSRTFRSAVVKDMLASIGQVDGLFEELRDRFDFVPLIVDLFRDVVTDIDAFERSDEEAQQRRQAREQTSQRRLAQQVQLESLSARAREEARGAREKDVLQARASADAAREAMHTDQEQRGEMQQMFAEMTAELRKELSLMREEHRLELQRMQREKDLEVEAQQQGVESQVGPGQREVKTTQ